MQYQIMYAYIKHKLKTMIEIEQSNKTQREPN